jgi:preprotein translocase subunit SecA
MTPADRPNYDRDGVMERLIPLLDETGRSEEADTLIEAEKARAAAWEAGIGLTDEQGKDDDIFTDAARAPLPEYVPSPSTDNPGTIARPGPKVGRNDPCPCGSGKKFKRCCGA